MAVNGRAALQAAEREWPDGVLLDLEMPVMDGYQAARALRELERRESRKRLTIVAISSNDEAAIIERALAAGCDHYLVKPADRKSTRLNSSHQIISYAVFCLKKTPPPHPHSSPPPTALDRPIYST